MSDTIDIDRLPDDTRIIVSVGDLRQFFTRALLYGQMDATMVVHEVDFTIKGDIA